MLRGIRIAWNRLGELTDHCSISQAQHSGAPAQVRALRGSRDTPRLSRLPHEKSAAQGMATIPWGTLEWATWHRIMNIRIGSWLTVFTLACLLTVEESASQLAKQAQGSPIVSQQAESEKVAAEASRDSSLLAVTAEGPAIRIAKIERITGACPEATHGNEVCENEGAFEFTFTFQRRGHVGQATVEIKTMDETAIAGQDYEATRKTVVWPPSDMPEQIVSVSIPLKDDSVHEPTETFGIEAFDPVPPDTELPTPYLQVTILDDDELILPTVSLGPESEVTVNECTGETSFAVGLEPASEEFVTVTYATSHGTATADVDYAHAAGTLVFKPGEIEKAVTVSILADNMPEDSETFSIALSNPVYAALDEHDRLLVTIEDASCLAIADVAVPENAGIMTFAVTLDAQIGEALSIRYATADGTATAGQDYAERSGELTFAPFSTEQTITVPILDDEILEPNETFTVTLTEPNSTTLVDLAIGTAVGTIIDDEEVSLSIADASAPEDSGQMEFVVTLSALLSEELEVDFRTSDATAEAGADYTATSGTLTFGVGSTEEILVVPLLVDAVTEDNEIFSMSLSSVSIAGITLLRETATGTILNDDFPTLSVADTVAAEGAGHAAFAVTLSEESRHAVRFRYVTSDGTAEAGRDYGMAGDIVTLEAGETEITIEVAIFEDALDEEDEDFTVTLTQPEGAALADEVATATIIDNDDPPGLSVQDATAVESAGAMAFTVVLDAASTKTISVEYATSGGSAEAGRDFEQTAGTVRFKPGVVEQTVSVRVLEDALDEDDETFTLTLSSAVNAKVTDGQATGTIIDESAPPGLSIADATALESDGSMVFAVMLSAESARELTVQFATSDGTALSGMDYIHVSGTLTFAPGDTTKQIAVPLLDDSVDEDVEAFTITLSSVVNATLVDDSAAGRISDNDERGIALTGTSLEIEEGSSDAYAVALMTQPTADVSVKVSGYSGDVSVDKPGLLFTPENWNEVQTVMVSAAEDDDAVPDDVVTLTHTATGADYVDLSGGTVAVTIRENDAVGVVIAPTVLAVEEGSSAAYTVVLTSAPTGPVMVSMTADLSATDLRVDPIILAFSAADWNQARPVTVEALDDLDVVEDDPISLPHMVSGADYEGVSAAAVVVTITEDETAWDVIGADWLARFGRTVANQAMTAIGSRLTTTTGAASRVRLGSTPRAPAGFGAGYGSYLPGREGMLAGRLLRQRSFDFFSMRRSNDTVERTMAWGRVADMRFAGTGTGFDMDGNVLTGMVGADFERNRLLFGLGASFAWADGEYDFGIGTEGQGSITTFLTSMYPYVRYRFTNRFLAWGLLGYGIGSLTLKEDGPGTDADAGVTMRMAGMGAHGSLFPGGDTGGFDLALRSDAFVVRTVSVEAEALARNQGDAARVRLALEGSYRTRLGASSVLTPSLEVAARQDAGHAEKGAGMELVGSLRFAAGNLAFKASGHKLILRQNRDYEEWGLGGMLRYRRGASGRGLSVAVRPTWGRASTGADLLWRSRSLAGLEDRRASPKHRLASEAGYGLGLLGRHGIITPFAAVDVEGVQSRTMRVGGRLRLGSFLRVRLEGGRRTGYYGSVQHRVTLRGVLDW